MSFLELDGWAVPVIDGSADEEVIEIGNRGRAFSGQLRSTRRAIKRRWKFTSAQLSKANAEALRGAIMGEGERFVWDTDLYGSKGTANDSSPVYTLRGAADGWPSTDVLSYKSLSLDSSATNIAAVKSTSSDNANWTPTGTASVANTTLQYYVATGCLAATFLAQGETVTRTHYSGTITSGRKYSTSLYLYSPDTNPDGVQVTVTTSCGAGSAEKLVTLERGKWNRVENITFTASGTSGPIVIEVEATSITDETSVYIDAIQLEERTSTTGFSTSFTSTSRAAAALQYSTVNLLRNNTSGATVSVWFLGPNIGKTGAATDIWKYTTSGSVSFLRLQLEADDDLKITVQRGTAFSANYTYSAPPWDETWHMLTFVLSETPTEDNKYKVGFYFDGVDTGVVSANVSELIGDVGSKYIPRRYVPNLSNLQTITFGALDSPMDDFVVLPYAATAEQISAWYYKAHSNRISLNGPLSVSTVNASNFGAVPAILASGDFLSGEEIVTVEGMVNSMRYRQGYGQRTITPTSTEVEITEADFKNNNQEIEFVLEEI